MTESGLYNTFEQDTKNFINQINDGLIKLENEGYSSEIINHIFRCIHSIKSEAAYLNLDEISSAAHDMESAIEPLRNVRTAVEVDPALIEFCFSTIDRIKTLAAAPAGSEDITELESLASSSGQVSEKERADVRRPYSEFELMLLREARARGEVLYELSFRISDEEAMKYARAYLAISNLEQKVNVIKVAPSPEELESAGAEQIKILLSASVGSDNVLDEINIDQIVDVGIVERSFEQELENRPAEAEKLETPVKQPERVISVEAEEIEAISNYVVEIKKRLSDLSSAFENENGTGGIDNNLAGLEHISESIASMMSNLQTVDFNNQFAGYKRTVRDLAADLGKRAELFFSDGNIRIQRDFAEIIAEPLLQLIRNAVVHGIESPEEREQVGKKAAGTIEITASETGGEIRITVSDDGSGINTAELPAEYQGISDDEQLLELLTQPGYTSLNESKHFGGRGVGLDLVANRIKMRGGRLELRNRPGVSCSFSIIIPAR